MSVKNHKKDCITIHVQECGKDEGMLNKLDNDTLNTTQDIQADDSVSSFQGKENRTNV